MVLRHAISKYIFRCLNKQWYVCLPIYLTAYNIPAVFSIIAWHLIRKHHLVYIDRKYFSYLSLLVKVFSNHHFLTEFEYFCYTLFRLSMSHSFKTTICYFHLFLSSDMRQSIRRSGCQAIFLLSGSSVFYTLHTIQ